MRRSTVLSLPSQLAFLGEADFNHFNFKTLSLSLSLYFLALLKAFIVCTSGFSGHFIWIMCCR